MQKFLTSTNKEVYYQPLQSIITNFDYTPESTLKDLRTLIKITAIKYDVHIVLSEFAYNEMDNILDTDISISGENGTNCKNALNFLRENLALLYPYAYFRSEYNDRSFRGIRIDWNHNGLDRL